MTQFTIIRGAYLLLFCSIFLGCSSPRNFLKDATVKTKNKSFGNMIVKMIGMEQ